MKKTSRKKSSKPIRQNRLSWRKKILGHKKIHGYQKPQKIKGKDWEKVS